MMIKRRLRAAVMSSLLIIFVPPLFAGEESFIYIDRLPDIQGELERKITLRDNNSGQLIFKEHYVLDEAHRTVETSVTSAACAQGALGGLRRIYIVAVRYLAKRPKTYRMATMADIYRKVFVEDQNGRIRLYQDVSSSSMAALFERFKPACLPV